MRRSSATIAGGRRGLRDDVAVALPRGRADPTLPERRHVGAGAHDPGRSGERRRDRAVRRGLEQRAQRRAQRADLGRAVAGAPALLDLADPVEIRALCGEAARGQPHELAAPRAVLRHLDVARELPADAGGLRRAAGQPGQLGGAHRLGVEHAQRVRRERERQAGEALELDRLHDQQAREQHRELVGLRCTGTARVAPGIAEHPAGGQAVGQLDVELRRDRTRGGVQAIARARAPALLDLADHRRP